MRKTLLRERKSVLFIGMVVAHNSHDTRNHFTATMNHLQLTPRIRLLEKARGLRAARVFWTLLYFVGSVFSIAGGRSLALAQSQPGWKQQWEQTVESARKEQGRGFRTGR
jgi:hypothetical protein